MGGDTYLDKIAEGEAAPEPQTPEPEPQPVGTAAPLETPEAETPQP